MQEEIDESTVIVGDFNTLVSEIGISKRQKISTNIIKFKCTINQLDIINIYRLIYSTTAKCMYVYQAHMEQSSRFHILGYKIHLHKFKIKIILNLLSDHNGMKQKKINNRKVTKKTPNMGRLNNTLLNNASVKGEI